MKYRFMVPQLLTLTLIGLSLASSAQGLDRIDDGTPRSFTERGIVLNKMSLRADGTVYTNILPNVSGENNTILLALGAGFSPLENLEVGIGRGTQQVLHVGPLLGFRDAIGGVDLRGSGIGGLVHPDPVFSDMNLYGRFRFLHTNSFEMGIDGNMRLPTRENSYTAFGASLPGRLRVGSLAIDFAPSFNIGVPEAGTIFQFGTPFDLAFNATESFYIRINSGLTGVFIDQNLGIQITLLNIPLKGGVGYTAEFGDGFRMDFEATGGAVDLVRFGDYAGDAVDPQLVEVIVQIRGYYDLS